jgi:hypothetical protein
VQYLPAAFAFVQAVHAVAPIGKYCPAAQVYESVDHFAYMVVALEKE